MKQLSILGSTGSIGVSALEVISNHPSSLKVLGLAAGRNIERLAEQIRAFHPAAVAVIDEERAEALRGLSGVAGKTKILWGPEGYREVATLPGAEMVLSAMVGAAGLLPTLEAIEAGKDIALANKETLVMAGPIVVAKAQARGIRILPVDSEHSAIFQCLQGQRRAALKKIVLTASGGPFLKIPRERLSHVTPADALKHPNWNMGRKITIDSASMMNKGLEVIEASWLFDVGVDDIEIVIHPQSIIHSMVEYSDGSMLAQLGVPDMKGPISYALFYPGRCPGGLRGLDLVKAGRLDFYEPDNERFPCLGLAYRAAKTGGTMPAVLNAANEIAVGAFLGEAIGFTDIPKIIGGTMSQHRVRDVTSVGDVLEADRWARAESLAMIEKKRG